MREKRIRGFKRRKEEQGSVLVLGVLFLAFMLLLAVPFLFMLSNENKSTERSYKSMAALSLAEAGVERAIWELNDGDIYGWSGTSSLRSMNIASFLTADGETMGSIDIRVIDPEGDTPVVESTGQVPYIGSLTVNRTARVELWKGDGTHYLFGYGVFGDEGIDINSKARIDSYNSTIADYDPQNPGTNGDIGTNATHLGCIFLSNNARVYGNATTGYESTPEDIIITQPGSTLTGDKLAMTKPQPLPSVAPPEESLSFMGEYFLGPGQQDVISESGEFTSFMLENNAKVTITADVTLYVTGDFSMNSFSQIEIAEGASVTVYLGGTFTQHSNTQVNNLTMDPTKLLFLGTDSFNGSLDWNATTTFYGSVYTPRAIVNYNSEADFYGAISGKYVDVNSDASLHYDEALGKHKVYTGTTLDTYIVKSWHELVPSS